MPALRTPLFLAAALAASSPTWSVARNRCMRPLLLILTLLLLSSCGSGSDADSVCGQACEQLQRCGVSRIHITSVKSYGFDADCSGVACDSITACVSGCINAADCAALQSVALGGALHSCLVGCNSWFRVGDAGP